MNGHPRPASTDGREQRAVGAHLEVRAGGGKSPTIVGRPVVYSSWSDDLGGFKERILPGAAARTIRADDIRALVNHDPNFVIGRTRSGTVELAEDSGGVTMRARPPETTWATDLLTSMRRGDIDQMSFAFKAVRDVWRKPATEGGLWERDIAELQMFDCSVVVFPAYPTTSAQVRSRPWGRSPATVRLLLELERAAGGARG